MSVKYSMQELLGNDYEESPEAAAYRFLLDFGDLVADCAHEQKMTFKELAKRAGMPASQLSNIIAGNGNPTVKTMERIAFALGCEISPPHFRTRNRANTESLQQDNLEQIKAAGQYDALIRTKPFGSKATTNRDENRNPERQAVNRYRRLAA